MKIRITLKDPNSMDDAVNDAVHEDTKLSLTGVTESERRAISQQRSIEFRSEIGKRWMRHGEYLTVEVDTDAWTATVLPAKEMV